MPRYFANQWLPYTLHAFIAYNRFPFYSFFIFPHCFQLFVSVLFFFPHTGNQAVIINTDSGGDDYHTSGIQRLAVLQVFRSECA